MHAFREAVLGALDDDPGEQAPRSVRRALAAARDALSTATVVPRAAAVRLDRRLAPRPTRGFAFEARAHFRVAGPAASPGNPQLERANMHSLLADGELAVSARGRTARLGRAHVFLVAEQLLVLTDDAIDVARPGHPPVRRLEVGEARIGLRHGVGDEPLTLSIGGPVLRNRDEVVNFPEIAPATFATATVRFVRALAGAFIENDASQAQNLRLRRYNRQAADALAERARTSGPTTRSPTPSPTATASFGLPRAATSAAAWEHGGKMRFLPRWVATVPGIDLRATFQCGERIVVGSAARNGVLQRAPRARCCGACPSRAPLAWRRPSASRASCPMAARAHRSGARRGTLHHAPRAARRGGGAAGAWSTRRACPSCWCVAEGDRAVTAIDLGHRRRALALHAARARRSYRMRRAASCCWSPAATPRSSRSTSPPAKWCGACAIACRSPATSRVDHDSAFALAGGPRARAPLPRRSLERRGRAGARELDERPAPGRRRWSRRTRVIVPCAIGAAWA